MLKELRRELPRELPGGRSILVVEEDGVQAKIIIETIAADNSDSVFWVKDVEAALDFLQQDDVSNAPRPDLILLDLELSDEKGHSLLTILKGNPLFSQIPIVVLAISQHPQDILQSYLRRGNCYVVKSCDRVQLAQVVQQIKSFWLGIVTLPMQSRLL